MPGAIAFHIARVVGPPFCLAVAALLAVDRVFRKFLPMVVGAPATLAILQAADLLVGPIAGGQKLLFAIPADSGAHACD